MTETYPLTWRVLSTKRATARVIAMKTVRERRAAREILEGRTVSLEALRGPGGFDPVPEPTATVTALRRAPNGS